MATTDADALFVDTNVLVYATVAESPFHIPAVTALERHHQAGCALWISRQVLREFYAALTRPGCLAQPPSIAAVAEVIRRIESQLLVADDCADTTTHMIELAQTFSVTGKQIHDANIVATMLTHGIRRILTHNVADFARYRSIIETVPLAKSAT